MDHAQRLSLYAMAHVLWITFRWPALPPVGGSPLFTTEEQTQMQRSFDWDLLLQDTRE